MKTFRAAFTLFLLLSSAACREKGAGQSGSGGASAPRRPRSTEVYEDKFRIGKTAAPDGAVITEADKFTAGEPIYISFVIQNAPTGASARVVWKRIDGDVPMGEEQKPLQSNGFVSFAVKDTSAWQPGAYRVDKSLGSVSSGPSPTPWKVIGSKDLTISPR